MNIADLAGKLDAALGDFGLIGRGGFDFGPSEDAPAGLSGSKAKSAVLVGQAGAENWPHFQAWLRQQNPKPENPLDTWSRELIGAVAGQFSARAVFPYDRPWLPFQQWATRAEELKPSPLGILMHPQYGLWHAWRGALLFDERLEIPKQPVTKHPCDTCVEKPCLTACPVGAFDGAGFKTHTCIDHVTGTDGAACHDFGCLARNACPVGREYRYPPAVQAFHQAAFLANNRPK